MDIYYQKYQKYKSKYLNQKLKNQTGGSSNNELYFFKADWCGHCKNFKNTWEELKNDSSLKDKIKFVEIDSEKNKKEMLEWDIKGFPTIIFKTNNKAIEYNGSRKLENIKEFVNQNVV